MIIGNRYNASLNFIFPLGAAFRAPSCKFRREA